MTVETPGSRNASPRPEGARIRLYAVRALFNAHEGKFIPTCRDLAIFVLRFDRRNDRLFASLDRQSHRLQIGFSETVPDEEAEAAPKPEVPVAEIGKKCMGLGFQQLLAAALG